MYFQSYRERSCIPTPVLHNLLSRGRRKEQCVVSVKLRGARGARRWEGEGGGEEVGRGEGRGGGSSNCGIQTTSSLHFIVTKMEGFY